MLFRSAKPAFTDEFARDATLRLTVQATPRHKLNFAASFQPNCNCIYNLLQASPPLSPEATGEHVGPVDHLDDQPGGLPDFR